MSVITAESEGGFTPPSAADFWQPLFGTDGNTAITRSMIVILLSVVLIAIPFVLVSRRMQVVPTKGQYLLESVYDFIRDGVAIDLLGEKNFRAFLPLLLTQFMLILVNNVFGIIPPVQFPTMSRIGFPIVLTLITFVVYHYVGIRRRGLGGYFASLMPPGVPGWIAPMVYLLELITFFITRPLTLAVRLFANMFAGHMMLLVFMLGAEYLLLEGAGVVKLAGVASFAMAIIMTFFELLVQALQAYVFVLLTAFYIAGSLADEH
ncbi:MAG: ATP synthase F0 subunit A [Micrococcales bacterium]|nr:MAG: ATP synthase F0 subunit A [Micrococcales bacterium]PIE27678.1 MAG: ATP synthase F0 subunit A [Micrococcales bacterium]